MSSTETGAASTCCAPDKPSGWLSGRFAVFAPVLAAALPHVGCAVALVSTTAGSALALSGKAGLAASAAGLGLWAWKRRRIASRIEKGLTIGLAVAGLSFTAYQNLKPNASGMPADCPMHHQP